MLEYCPSPEDVDLGEIKTLANLKTALSRISRSYLETTSDRKVEPGDLPFPPDDIKGLTGKDIIALQGIACCEKPEIYRDLVRLYIWKNVEYSSTAGRALVDEMKRYGLPVPLSFFLLMYGVAAQRHRVRYWQVRVDLKEADEEMERLALRVEGALEVLVDFMEEWDRRATYFDMYYSFRMEKWRKKTRFSRLLAELVDIVQERHNHGSKSPRSILPGGKKENIAPEAKRSYEALYKLAQQAKRKNRLGVLGDDAAIAKDFHTTYNPEGFVDYLFSLAGARVTRGAQKMWNSRRKKQGSNKAKKEK